jgi:hypothetical protein
MLIDEDQCNQVKSVQINWHCIVFKFKLKQLVLYLYPQHKIGVVQVSVLTYAETVI